MTYHATLEAPAGMVFEEAREPERSTDTLAILPTRLEYACGHIGNVSVWKDPARRAAQEAKLAKIPCPQCMDCGFKKK